MKLIVGLGNPEEKYLKTRHNAGFMVVERVAAELGIPSFKSNKKLLSLITSNRSIILAKPTTFMNSSGRAVAKLVSHFKVDPDSLWVVHDDLDIPLGKYKIQKGVGPKIHKGIASIEESLGRDDFWRVRVGVDNRNPLTRIAGEQYVLQNFSQDELKIILSVIGEIARTINGY